MRKKPPKGALMVEERKSGPVWVVKFRDPQGRQKRPTLGRAWLEPDDGSNGKRRRTRYRGWLHRRGEAPDGWLDEEAAKREAKKLIGSVYAARPRRTTFEAVAKQWLAERSKVAGWKATTERNYRAMLNAEDDVPGLRGHAPRARLMRAFGGRRIEDIDEAAVRGFLRQLDRDESIGPRSVNAHRSVLHGMMEYAVEHGYRSDNPVARVPKRREPDKRELIVYSPEQIELIASMAEDARTAALIRVAAYTGLRLGELLELRWRDVRFSEDVIHVQRSRSGGMAVSTPKARRGRSVPLSEQAARVLARLSQQDDHVRPNDLVFCRADGRPLDQSYARKRWYKARQAAHAVDPDLPVLTVHELRHTFGSRLAAAGVPLLDIKEFMGHSSITTTMIYLHFVPKRDAAATLTAALGATGVEAVSVEESVQT